MMKLTRLLSLCVLLLAAIPTVQAQTSAADTDFCDQWFHQSTENSGNIITSPGNKLSIVLQALKLKFLPDQYSQPEFSVVKPAHQVAEATSSSVAQADSRNVIFFVGAPPEALSNESRDQAQAKLHSFQKKVKPLVKNVLKLTKTKDLASCVALEKKMNFNYDDYANLIDENGSLINDRQISNEDSALKSLKSAVRGAQLHWEIHDYTDLNDVFEALKDPKIENVVIVAHGQSNSMILDSRWNEYPKGFFNTIAPHLRSLNFYQCYSQSLPKQYDLANLFQSSPSFYSSRLITTVKKNEKVYEQGMAPLNGFPHYLHTLEGKIQELKSAEVATANLPVYQAPAECSAEFKVPPITAGNYGFFVNLKFIGSAETSSAGEHEQTFHFPCALIDRPVNILNNRNINAVTTIAQITGKSFDLVQWTDPNGSRVAQTNHYHTATGAYQSSKWQINAAPVAP